MKTVKISIVALLIMIFCVVLIPHTTQGRGEFGVGGKLVGSIPLVIASFDLNQFGGEVGGWIRSTGYNSGSYSFNMSVAYYLANGRFIIPLNRQLKPYLGAGVIGTSVTGSSSGGTTEISLTGGATGFDLFGGVEFELKSFGLPISIFGGLDYLGFEDVTLTYDGESFTYPIGIGGTSFHVGIKFEF